MLKKMGFHLLLGLFVNPNPGIFSPLTFRVAEGGCRSVAFLKLKLCALTSNQICSLLVEGMKLPPSSWLGHRGVVLKVRLGGGGDLLLPKDTVSVPGKLPVFPNGRGFPCSCSPFLSLSLLILTGGYSSHWFLE